MPGPSEQASIETPGFHLPDNPLEPNKVCVTLQIPDDQWHKAAFLGAIFMLSQWIAWQRDEARTGKLVAGVWREIYRSIVFGNCNPPLPPGGDCGEGDCMCCLRWQNGVLQMLQCGVWTDVPGGGPLSATQPGSDQGGRPAVGASSENCYHLDANGVLLLPFQVYPGDTVQVTSATGAGSDAPGVSNWFCPDGTPFVFGACVGIGGPVSGDPLPSANHMRLIYKIGTTFIDAMGGAVVVAGSGPQPIGIQVNDASITDDPGSYELCVKLTNGQQGTFSHTFDFTLNPSAWDNSASLPNLGLWVAGMGWTQSEAVGPGPDGTDHYEGVGIAKTFASRTITKIHVAYTYAIGQHRGTDIFSDALYNQAGNLQVSPQPATGDGTLSFDFTGSVAMTKIGIVIVSAIAPSTTPSPTGTVIVSTITVEGIGTDPF